MIALLDVVATVCSLIASRISDRRCPAGTGLVRLAVERLGWRVALANDIEPCKARTGSASPASAAPAAHARIPQ